MLEIDEWLMLEIDEWLMFEWLMFDDDICG